MKLPKLQLTRDPIQEPLRAGLLLSFPVLHAVGQDLYFPVHMFKGKSGRRQRKISCTAEHACEERHEGTGTRESESKTRWADGIA